MVKFAEQWHEFLGILDGEMHRAVARLYIPAANILPSLHLSPNFWTKTASKKLNTSSPTKPKVSLSMSLIKPLRGCTLTCFSVH